MDRSSYFADREHLVPPRAPRSEGAQVTEFLRRARLAAPPTEGVTHLATALEHFASAAAGLPGDRAATLSLTAPDGTAVTLDLSPYAARHLARAVWSAGMDAAAFAEALVAPTAPALRLVTGGVR